MNLKVLRKQNNITQEELSKILHTTQQTYARYELGTSEPTIETLIKLADYYNVSLDYLVDRQFNNDVGYLSVDDKNFVKMYLSLDDYSKVKAIGYVAGLLASR